MRNSFKFIFVILLAVFSTVGYTQRTVKNFGSDWEFRRDDNSPWEKISLPHTARVEKQVVIDQFQGKFYYRKKFSLPKSSGKTFLYFEGVMRDAEVWVNGKKLVTHKGGYLPFTIDITDIIFAGKNTIAMTVVNIDDPTVPPGKPLKDLDFNFYGGIYRNAYIITTSDLHITDAVDANKIASGGIFVNFDDVSKAKASGTIKVHLKNESNLAKNASLKFTLTSPDRKPISLNSWQFSIPAGSDKEIVQNVEVPDPKLWSVSNPNLYSLRVEVRSGSNTVDVVDETFGIRKSEMRSDGYYLNGEKLFITGTNRHQEYPYIGYAISDEAQYRDAVKIKNAGFDFVRLSHYPQAEAFLDACDRLGILVMNSIPGWQFFGEAEFQKQSLQNVRDMARRDRNHPSVVFWEVSLNESGMTPEYMQAANAALREELPGRTNTAGWIDHPSYDLYIPARQHAKAPDYWTKYDKGSRKIFIAEYGDWEYYAQNAGFSQKEFANLKEDERTSRQLRSFGEKRLLQQAFNFQEASNSNRKGKNTIGEANWLMFDYNRGYSPDIESSGISDIFRIPKFAYDFYRSQRDADFPAIDKTLTGPMVSIATYWTSASLPEIRVYSNCEEVALYLNDKLISKNRPNVNAASDSLKHAPFLFNLGKFAPGTLRAEGFIGGKKVAESVVRTPGAPAKIELAYDLSSVKISAETPDVIFVYAKIADENGTVVADAVNQITFSITGDDAELIGQNPMQAEAGISTILLRTEKFKSKLTISASASGLQSANIDIKP